ncbi:spore germination protein, partial [Bacillus haynesii]
KLFMLILVALFKVEGFVIGLTILTIVMTSIRSLRTPYLWPLLPFNGK